MKFTLGESKNGYAIIEVDAPYELFGEFMCAEHSTSRAERIAAAVDDVLSGKSMATIAQDYGVLSLDKESGTARVWIDNLSHGVEEECEMALAEFQKLSTAWLDFIRARG